MAATGPAAQGPNQTAASLPYASLQLRAVAAILDAIILVSCFMLLVAVGGLQALLRSDGDPPDSAFYIWAGFIVAFIPAGLLYFTLLWSRKGGTVGMMAVHIKVTRRDGGRLSFGRALLRTLAWPLSLLPLGLGLITILVDEENRALHDYLADTAVLELP